MSVVTISYLHPGGSPGHLRHLVKRLRERAAGPKIIVGLWPDGDIVAADVAVQRAAGADVYVRSLREAVDAAVAAMRVAG